MIRDRNHENIRAAILLPLAITMVLLLTLSVVSLFWFPRNHLREEIAAKVNSVQRLFEMELEKDAGLMDCHINELKANKELQDAWLANDRDALLDISIEYYEKLHSELNVTHFYFTGMDRECVLRVHNPARHGDYIDRITMDLAEREQKPSCGIELGLFGTLTLRTVHPWRIDGEPAGYIELGKEIGQIMTEELSNTLGSEILFTINKSFIDRARWEEGMKMTGQAGEWKQLPNFVVYGSSISEIPERLNKYLNQIQSCEDEKHLSTVIKTLEGNRKYHCAFTPLIDAGGRDVGDIIIVTDVTETYAAIRKSILWSAIGCITIFIVLFRLFYVFLGRVENKLVKSHCSLKEEIDSRKLVEDALISGQRQMQAILDNSSTVVYIKDLEGKYLLINRKYEELFHLVL